MTKSNEYFNLLRGQAILCTLSIVILFLTGVSEGVNQKGPFLDGDPNPNAPYARNPYKEFEDFCEAQELRRNNPEKIDKDECKKIDEREFHKEDLNILFTIFVVLLYGAILRSIQKFLHITVPYTVFMMISGMVVGQLAKHYCYEMYSFTAIARLNAKVYLYTFLPVLLFESSFSISGHVFLKAAGQVLVLAGPGMLMCTVLTAFSCYIFFSVYEWSILESFLFGSIVSATDPVAVVAILKELGVAETFSVLVDGESLLNDGVAILLYEVFYHLLSSEGEPREWETVTSDIIGDFFRIAIGGPAFGFGCAKIAIFCLTRVFNDAVVEITITIVATYMTYFIAEYFLGVSGVMAVVILGITMSAEKTCISPTTEHELHEFWSMLGHLANTVLFFITGVIITERGTRGIKWTDLYYLILLYCALNLVRFLMLLVFSPILRRTGYGMPWENMIVLMWGGLRGAVGICLSLEVYEDPQFCKTKLGPKVMLQTAGIVFLTLCVNGTTTKKLLEVLKMTEISAGRMEEMKNAVKTITIAQRKALLMLRHDRFLSDANWAYVSENTHVEDPYKHQNALRFRKPEPTSILSLGPEVVMNECPECKTVVQNVPTNEELKEMTNEARLRVIKAMKISYWAHFEKGVLTEVAVQILAGTADSCADKELYMIHTKDLKKYWQIRGVFPFLKEQISAFFGDGIPDYPPRPILASSFKLFCWKLATKAWFDYLLTFIVIVNMIVSILQLVIENTEDPCTTKNEKIKLYDNIFQMVNIGFTAIYVAEFAIKIVGLGVASYASSRWNWLDFSVLAICLIDVVLSFMNTCGGGGHATPRSLFKMLKIIRCFRSVKLFKPLAPLCIGFINGKINTQLFLGYDVALGFIMGCDDVLKFLPHMIENKKVYMKIRNSIERERLEAVREMGNLQKSYPGIAIAIKTRHASRSVLNQMKATLTDLRGDGLLDEKENEILCLAVQEKMKNLLFFPSSLKAPAPESILENLNWVYNHDELREFIYQNATLLQFEVNDKIYSVGDPPQGIYVIVSGMVRIRYEPNLEVKADKEAYGVIPNMEIFKDFDFDKPFEDLYAGGTVIGESSCLTGRVRAASVTCETEGVTAFHIPLSAMLKALDAFTDEYNSLEDRLWRSCGMRRAGWFLLQHPFYQAFSKEKIETILERSCSPIGPQFDVIQIPPYVQDIIVIEGWVEDGSTGELYIAPAVVHRNCSAIKMRPNPKTMNRVLVVLAEDKGPEDDDPNELAKCFLKARAQRKSLDDKTVPANGGELDKQKRVSVAVNYGVRTKGSRKSMAAVVLNDPKKQRKSRMSMSKTLKPPNND